MNREAGGDVSHGEVLGILEGAGVPGPFAGILADSDVGASRGELNDATGELRRLIGRATTPLADAVAVALER
jgi:NAD(P)H dehydrogenase (quinone)